MSTTQTLSLHERLEISFAELGALLGTRNMLAAGLLKHDFRRTLTPDEEATGVHKFTMSRACAVHGCASVGCIGGTMGMIMGLDADGARDYVHRHSFDSVHYDRPIARLFYPPGAGWDWITPPIAVKAIDWFLNTGDPHWNELLVQRTAGLI